jgi:hypothetical protein
LELCKQEQKCWNYVMYSVAERNGLIAKCMRNSTQPAVHTHK